mgnify:CR=1 FL=1
MSRNGLYVFFRFLGAAVCLACLIGVAEVQAAERADELYQEGRFQEAGQRYNELDMEHPNDLRYRYNRGCAAYQAGDYKSAGAAFSSVMRRVNAAGDSKDDLHEELRSKALYNLGNVAFQQGDFGSAAGYYKEAMGNDEIAPDARHNFELALRRLEEEKKKEEKSDRNGAGASPGDKGGERENREDPGANEQQPPERGGPENDQQPEPDKPKGQDGTQPQGRDEKKGKEDDRSPETGKGSDAPPEDLSGKLTGQQNMPGTREELEPAGDPTDGSAMNRQKAEALLDNVSEDRSRFLRFQVPEEKAGGVQSGKDW